MENSKNTDFIRVLRSRIAIVKLFWFSRQKLKRGYYIIKKHNFLKDRFHNFKILLYFIINNYQTEFDKLLKCHKVMEF